MNDYAAPLDNCKHRRLRALATTEIGYRGRMPSIPRSFGETAWFALWPSAKPAVDRVAPPPNARARRLAAICSIGVRFPRNLISRASLVPTFEDEVGAIA